MFTRNIKSISLVFIFAPDFSAFLCFQKGLHFICSTFLLLFFFVIYEFINPRFVIGKLPMFGKTAGRSVSVKPNHRASVPAYCSTLVVGSHRPRGFVPSMSSGPPTQGRKMSPVRLLCVRKYYRRLQNRPAEHMISPA